MTSIFRGTQFARKTLGAALVSGLLLFARPACAADRSLPVNGNLLGTVFDDTGAPQMGATIQLLNKYNHVIANTRSGPHGQFAFVALPDDVYSLRAAVPSFLPAVKNRILVQGGFDSVLQVHLATLFSSIELSYSLPNAAMTDDWKWVLRSAAATRPINRFLDVTGKDENDGPPPVFSQTHAVVFLSGGDGGFTDSDSSFSDLGTGFALSTNILGNNQVKLSGTFGQGPALGTPQMALMAAYARKNKGTLAEPPEVTLTMTQVGGLGVQQQLNGSAAANAGMGGTVPLRALSLATYNATDIIDGVHLEYGVTSESVDYLQHTSRISPFGRVTLDSGKAGEIVMAYSAGGRPNLLARRDQQEEENGLDDLSSARTGVGHVPEVSIRDGRLRLERTQNAEVGMRKTIGDTTLAASMFYEDTVNGRINVAGDVSDLDSSNLLSDSLSTTSFLSIGNYRRSGYLLSSSHSFGDNLEVSLAYGRMGGFSAAGLSASSDTGRNNLLLDQNTTNLAVMNVKASVPVLATQINAGYGWVEGASVIPQHMFTTQSTRVAPGLNIYFRQPLPTAFGLPGRLELTGSLQNLLAQGYLPFDNGDGRRMLVVQAPRAIRGGLNFIF